MKICISDESDFFRTYFAEELIGEIIPDFLEILNALKQTGNFTPESRAQSDGANEFRTVVLHAVRPLFEGGIRQWG